MVIEKIKNSLMPYHEKKWVTVYLYFPINSKTSKRFLNSVNKLAKDINYDIFINKDKVNELKNIKKTVEIHIAPRSNALTSPKRLIKTHYKLILFSRKLNKHLKEPKPEYRTDISLKSKRKIHVFHKYGHLYIMYNLRDRIKFEKDSHFFGVSNKIFVESVEELKKHIVKSS